VESVHQEANKIGAQPLVVYGFYRTPMYVAFPSELLEREGKTIRLEESMDLEEFLENFDMSDQR
jgi:hypothetical protein